MCGLVGLVAAGLSILLVGLVVSSLLVGLLLRSELLRSCGARDLLHGRPARGAELLTVGHLGPAFRTEHSYFLLDEPCTNGTALRRFIVQALVSRELIEQKKSYKNGPNVPASSGLMGTRGSTNVNKEATSGRFEGAKWAVVW